MIEPKTKEIDGCTYTYNPLLLKPARLLFNKLLNRFGPAIASAVEGLESADFDTDSEVLEAIGTASQSAGNLMRELVKGLDEKFHAELCDKLAAQTQVDEAGNGNLVPLTQVRELLFAQNLTTEFKVVLFCLEVQYQDFLAPLRSLAEGALAARAAAGSRSASLKGSIGQSTGSPFQSDTATA
jgi:hypothetical protein